MWAPSAATREGAPATPFDQLADHGIDVDVGLANHMRRKSFYTSVLRGFVSEYGGAPALLQEWLAAAAAEGQTMARFEPYS